MTAYYNEIDPFATQWLRNLISAGLIAPGEVDERSIEDVRPLDIRSFTQCHFFAGIGIWSYALRSAGWEDSRRVWTGSCPCQPFSAAGKGAGFADERHLWPAWFHLIGERRPPVVFGEQVAGKNGLAWLDLVQTDMEALDYACGAVVAPAAGFGAPHIRERLYWVAYADNAGSQRRDSGELRQRAVERSVGTGSTQSRLGHAEGDGRLRRQNDGNEGRRERTPGQAGAPERVADSDSENKSRRRVQRPVEGASKSTGASRERSERLCTVGAANPTNGEWRDADWLLCTDGKWKPVEPGSFPLADGIAGRVGRLRAYGNAIVAPQAQAFIEAAMEYAP